ncbi:MAG: maltoporin [Thiotrichales bacterium]
MRNSTLSSLTLAVLAIVGGHPVAAVDLSGYIRALDGEHSESGDAACFKLAGAGSKYRLGNECEIYGEALLGHQFTTFGDGGTIKGQVMFSVFKPTSDSAMLTDKNAELDVAQAYLHAENLSVLNGGGFWAGRRYYKREDIHVSDFFYWNPQGLGAGIEDVTLGGVKLSYALFREDNQDQVRKATRHDIQVRGVQANVDGELEFGLSLIPDAGLAAGGDSGWALTVQHRQSNILGDGWNKLALQYGTGPGTGLGGTGPLTNTTEVERLRVVEGIYAQLTPRLGGMLTAVYQRDESSAGSQTWTSFGGRVTYGVSRHFKMQAELGHDRVKPSGGDARDLTKLTLAPTWALAPKFWARPELRLFYTHARWNDAAALAANGSSDAAVASISDTGAFSGVTQGSTIGLQFEGWW